MVVDRNFILMKYLLKTSSSLIDFAFKGRSSQKFIISRLSGLTMIYTHVLNRGGRGVRSPLDP
jgi:hypothetical protein